LGYFTFCKSLIIFPESCYINPKNIGNYLVRENKGKRTKKIKYIENQPVVRLSFLEQKIVSPKSRL
jgi:hypothetical protein